MSVRRSVAPAARSAPARTMFRRPAISPPSMQGARPTAPAGRVGVARAFEESSWHPQVEDHARFRASQRAAARIANLERLRLDACRGRRRGYDAEAESDDA